MSKDKRFDALLGTLAKIIPKVAYCEYYEVIDRGIYLCKLEKDDDNESLRTDCCGELVKCEREEK